VKNNNEKLKSELDEIFIERKKIEEETENIQNELQNIHKQMELRLNELDPYQRTEYQKLINENNELISEYNSKQGAMEELLNKLANAENKLRMDSQKLKGQLLKDQIAELEVKKTDYEIQLNEANLSIPEARDRILARMKEDNTSIANMEKR
jgi:intraflagellar transport protein 74